MPVVQDWQYVHQMVQHNWMCGYCGQNVAGNLGYYWQEGRTGNPKLSQRQLPAHEVTSQYARIFICPLCNEPTYFRGGKQVPGVAYGKPVQHLPDDLNEIYDEARNCMAVNAFIPAVLTARTILMHIAVEQGAAEGLTFAAYVDHLVSGGFTPPNAKGWIDHIRKLGNAATHKIELVKREDAEKVLRFIEMILLFLYEYPKSV